MDVEKLSKPCLCEGLVLFCYNHNSNLVDYFNLQGHVTN